MATITKRPGKNGVRWRAQIRKQGVMKSATFDTKAAAQRWVLSLESQIEAGEFSGIPLMTFGELLDKYMREKSPDKASCRQERYVLRKIGAVCVQHGSQRIALDDIQLADLDKGHFQQWQNQRLEQVSVGTVLRERASLTAVFSQAMKWEFLKKNPLKDIEKPKEPPPRTRRLSQFEIDQLTHAADFSFEKPPLTMTQRTAAAMLFAIETAMRAGEIVGLEWVHIDFANNTAFLPKTKNGHPRTVPLSPFALKILNHLGQVTGEAAHPFGLTSASLDALFRKLKARCGIEDLHFHDTRREAASRLAKILSVMELAKVTGHRDISILQNTYYAPDMGEMAQRLATNCQSVPIASETEQARRIAQSLHGNGTPPANPAEAAMLNALRQFMQQAG